jgi:arylsulfatase
MAPVMVHWIRIAVIPIAIVACGAPESDAPPEPVSSPPNFVFVLADDLGYNDLGVYNSMLIETPRIDRMAREGLRLTSFYTQPICGPARAALMTGSYPIRVADRGEGRYVHPRLHEDEITVAEVLAARGYATACFGKWDLAGHTNTAYLPELLPERQGFDEHFGLPSSNDAGDPVLLRNGRVVESPVDQTTLTRRYADEAIRFIEAHADEPFFVYLPLTMPHVPIRVSEEFVGRSRRGPYGDAVEEIDWNVGRLLDTLETLDLARSTYVIFTSDNGPWIMQGDWSGSARPLRGGKVSTWEGGVRVPFIVWAPGRVPAAVASDELVTAMDILPTFTALAGAELPDDRVLDGRDVSALWHGAPGASRPDPVFYYYLSSHLQAVRQGRWKLHLPRPARPPWLAPLVGVNHVRQRDYVEIRAPLLFDLEADIGERHDVAERHPEVVERLLKLAERARADLGDHDRVGKGQRFFD